MSVATAGDWRPADAAAGNQQPAERDSLYAGRAVTIQLSESAEKIRTVVENPGAPIAAHLPRLFDRFYRVDLAPAQGEGGGIVWRL